MIQQDIPFLGKTRQSLAGAEREFVNAGYSNCANRAYYATFQAAIAALQHTGIWPRGERWSYEFVPAQFDGVLLNRRHLYPTELRTVIERNHALLLKADYRVRIWSHAPKRHAP